jgi:dipeptidyl aminopeptidase/acylaminoacyl peptidase
MRTQSLWLAVGLVLGLPALRSAEGAEAAERWETLPDGILGRVACFEGVGGVRIAGHVRRPEGKGPFPLVILLHGGAPTAKPVIGDDEESRKARLNEAKRAAKMLGRASNGLIQEFLRQGWAVYSLDYRPNPRYTLDPFEWDDTLVAIKQARAWSFVDSKRIAIVGGSHGGHVTGRMIARTDFACAVLCAPAGLDLIELSHAAASGTPIGANQRLIRELEQRSGLPMAEFEKQADAQHYSSLLTEVAQVRCPILLISGRNDPNAPLPVMDAYTEKLRAEHKAIETYHPDNGPHGFYFGVPKVIPETAESTRRQVDFIKKQFEAAEK